MKMQESQETHSRCQTKCKTLRINSEGVKVNLSIKGTVLEKVTDFKYLGDHFNEKGNNDTTNEIWREKDSCNSCFL